MGCFLFWFVQFVLQLQKHTHCLHFPTSLCIWHWWGFLSQKPNMWFRGSGKENENAGEKTDQKSTLKSCNFTALQKTTGTREHLSSCKQVSLASEYNTDILKELNRHVLIPHQDKADHFRLAFMLGQNRLRRSPLRLQTILFAFMLK